MVSKFDPTDYAEACRIGDMAKVEFYCNAYPRESTWLVKDGLTGLMIAAGSTAPDSIKVVKFLTEQVKGYPLSVPKMVSHQGYLGCKTALNFAIDSNNVKKVHILKDKCVPLGMDNFGKVPTTCSNPSRKILKIIEDLMKDKNIVTTDSLEEEKGEVKISWEKKFQELRDKARSPETSKLLDGIDNITRRAINDVNSFRNCAHEFKDRVKEEHNNQPKPAENQKNESQEQQVLHRFFEEMPLTLKDAIKIGKEVTGRKFTKSSMGAFWVEAMKRKLKQSTEFAEDESMKESRIAVERFIEQQERELKFSRD